MTNRKILCDMGYEDTVVFENPDYDSAIIGVSSDGRAVYSYNLMIEHLVETEKMRQMKLFTNQKQTHRL